MNKAQTAKQLAKQTVEQEHDLRTCFLKETSEIKTGVVALMTGQKTIIQNQQIIHEAIKSLNSLREEGTNPNQAAFLQELLETKQEYQKMKRLIVICFLTVLVPLLAVLAALLAVYLLTT